MLVIAHRGARDRAPENTLAAFEAALDDGVRAIEFDVQVTADGIAVLCHDDHLQRVSGADARISRSSYADLRGIAVRGDAMESQPIPTLEATLELLEGRAQLFVELKASFDLEAGFRSSLIAAEVALPMLRGCSDIIVSSFDPAGPAYVRAHSDLPIAHGVVAAAACTPWASTARAAGAIQAHVESTLVDPEAMQASAALELEVCAWTVNDPAIARRFERLGVAGIFCDAPGAMLRALGTRDADA